MKHRVEDHDQLVLTGNTFPHPNTLYESRSTSNRQVDVGGAADASHRALYTPRMSGHENNSGFLAFCSWRVFAKLSFFHDRKEHWHQYENVNRRGDHATYYWRRDWLHHVGADAALP